MTFAHTTYTLLLTFAASVAGLIAVLIYRRRHSTASAAPLLAFMLALCWWDLTYAVYWSGLFAPTPTFWLDATFLGVVAAPTAFFAFSVQYTRTEPRFSRTRLLLLSVMPLLILLALWTDPWHGLFFGRPRDTTRGTILGGGPLFWVAFVYLYSLNLAAVVRLFRAFRGASALYRAQARLVLLGALCPWIGNFISVVGLDPLPQIDLTPLAFTLTGAAFAYALFFYGLLDIVPVARTLLIEHMGDGVMVLDAVGRVVDINLAARDMFGITMPTPVGQPVTVVLTDYPQLVAYAVSGTIPDTIRVTRAEPPQVLDIRVVTLPSQARRPPGYLVVVRDITDQVRAEAEIRTANEHLRQQLAEIERLQQLLRDELIHDSLTGLFNRRFFDETVERELARAEREGQPLAVILLDIDRFKAVNDTFGHSAGDTLLQAVGSLLHEQTRGGDVMCRYGGEEFAIVMPGASGHAAAARVDDMRARMSELLVPHSGHLLQATISAGVAEYPTHGRTRDQLLQAADEAMYRSKRSGRNRVTLSDNAVAGLAQTCST